ncbi:oxygen-independent coproporphyrinogen III oxidase [Roseovarius sp. CAU 1744]|uniref:oxygen-independent coproporphyrinogen III oxidase n=1 Tax=Roseovarius sp. CAU 1744 TaxID=3140368 RepID=UPI00325AB4A5
MVTKAQLGKLGLFDAKVPRYTSYPTAPHFSRTVDSSKYTRWIRAIKPDARISLYVHVPFCRRLCWFCACRTQGTQTDKPVLAYLDTLKAELRMLAAHLPRGVRLSRLHWGGGTPTLLAPAMMEELAGAIRDVAPFTRETEFSVEIDPNEIDGPRLDALAAAGMNRASIGVQDFDETIQQSIGRLQSYEVTRQAVDEIRARGVTSLNCDILYGLPHQSRARITESVQKLLSLYPDRVALYGYAHVPWMAKRQQLIPSDALPTPEERLALYDTARRLFLWDHYTEIGIDHFATAEDGLSTARKTGRLRRNFQGYTDDTAEVLIGVGASAISRFPQGYAQNAPATGAHTAAIRAGQFSTTRGHEFTADDKMRSRMIEALMCDFRIDAAEIRERFSISGATLSGLLADTAQAFDGLLIHDETGLSIPPDARMLTRMIARSLDAYDLSKAGHSAAI